VIERNPETLHQNAHIFVAGQSLGEANAAMILLHGRGASARDILGLEKALHHPEMSYLAPQAANAVWYPYRFLAPLEQNEPWLSSALQLVGDLLSQCESAGIPTEKIILAGFSQGACLATEFVARHPRRYGGLLAFSGGLIGPPGTNFSYTGSLAGTPTFIGCDDRDPHIPLERVQESAAALTELGAQVKTKIYPGMGHTILEDEIAEARLIVSSLFD
jgi:predicted esterase